MLDAVHDHKDVGQQLGDWLNFRQAIALQAVLQSGPTGAEPWPAHVQRVPLLDAPALNLHVAKVRSQLADSIAHGAPPGSGLPLVQMPNDTLDLQLDPKTAFAPYRRFISAHQRQMESTLRSLRSSVRVQLHRRGGRLQHLAALDAALENTLGEREAMLLDKVSKMMEKRFVQAFKAHLKQSAEFRTELTEPVETDVHPAGSARTNLKWLSDLRQALRQALLAELDTRLQPTLGLLEAFSSDTQKQ